MSDNVVLTGLTPQPDTTSPAPTTEQPDYRALWENEQREKELVHSKNQELLAEKRRIAERMDQAEREKTEERNAKLLQQGKFEELYKSAQEEKRLYQEKVQTLDNERSFEKSKTEAMKLASQLADGHNAEILTEFLVRRIKYTGDGVRILDANGAETVSTLADLKNEYENSQKFKSLLRGSKASGGGAPGSGNPATPGASTVSRAQFNSMNATQRMQFSTSGGKIEN